MNSLFKGSALPSKCSGEAPVEFYNHYSPMRSGITLLPASSVEGLLLEKRRHELVQPFKLALLKLASQVGSRIALPCFTCHNLTVTWYPTVVIYLSLGPRSNVKVQCHTSCWRCENAALFIT